jgi:hypothetical protein
MSSNSTSKMVQLAGRFGSHSRALSALISLVIVLAACSGSTPPGPNSIEDVVEQARYLSPAIVAAAVLALLFPAHHFTRRAAPNQAMDAIMNTVWKAATTCK